MNINKSATYIFPLVMRNTDNVNSFIHKSNYPANLFYNTYLYLKENKTTEILNIIYKNDNNTIFKIFEDNHLFNNNFINKIEYGIYNCYQYKIPDNFIKDYYKFIDGKYSKLSEEAKKKIMLFANLTKFSDDSKNSKIVNVLYKSEYLKNQIEEAIGIELDKNCELSSTIYENDETFDINNFLIKN